MPMLPDSSSRINKIVIDTTATTPILSTELDNSATLLNLQADGTATSFTVLIESKLDASAAYQPLASFNLADISKTTDGQILANGVYQTAVAGIPFLKISASGIIGGTLKVWMTN